MERCLFLFCLTKKTHGGVGIRRNKYNRDPPRDMAEPVHNSVTAIATGKPLLAHGDQETRQLAVMLVQALSTPRGGPPIMLGG